MKFCTIDSTNECCLYFSADGRRIPKNNSRRDFVLDIEDNDNLTDNAIPQLVQHQDLDEILNEPIKMPEARSVNWPFEYSWFNELIKIPDTRLVKGNFKTLFSYCFHVQICQPKNKKQGR